MVLLSRIYIKIFNVTCICTMHKNVHISLTSCTYMRYIVKNLSWKYNYSFKHLKEKATKRYLWISRGFTYINIYLSWTCTVTWDCDWMMDCHVYYNQVRNMITYCNWESDWLLKRLPMTNHVPRFWTKTAIRWQSVKFNQSDADPI